MSDNINALIEFLFSDVISTLSIIIPAIVAAVVFIYQHLKLRSERFVSCTDSLHSGNDVNMITSAILLRSFLRRGRYKRDAVNVVAALLRVLPNGQLQKTLGDGLTCVKSAKGQDFQRINLYDALIKPRFYLLYDFTGVRLFASFRNCMKGADFFQANLSAANINSVNFNKAFFYETNLCSARFRCCTFRNTDFRFADLNGVRFIDCDLDGAVFTDSRRLDKAYVVIKQGKKERKVPLTRFLDSQGVFRSIENEHQLYVQEIGCKRIFVSRLGLMDSRQQMHYDGIKSWLKNNYNVDLVCLDRNDYLKYGQLSTIKNQMDVCSGAVVFAFSYLHVYDGEVHKYMSEPDREIKRACTYPSPWIQIETAFANSLELPTLVIAEEGLECNGIFDHMIVDYDPLMFKIAYKGGALDESKVVIDEWFRKVENSSR